MAEETAEPHERAAARERPVRRRIRTTPPPGSDPHPDPEPDRGSGRDNDDRLRAEKPPHY